MNRALVSFCLCLAAVPGSLWQTASGPQMVHVAETGETAVSAGRYGVMVKIKTCVVAAGTGHQLTKFCPHGRNDAHFGIVDSLEIVVRGHPLNVPLSAFSDLSEIHYARLVGADRNFTLILDGGDASTSYVVKIQFDQEMVKHRTLAPGEFPEEVMEETTYYKLPALGD